MSVGLVQANIGISPKGRLSSPILRHKLHLEQSIALQRRGAELIIWPESAYPFVVDRSSTTDFPDGDHRKLMQGINVPLIFGAASFTRGDPYPFNTAFMMEPTGQITGRFDKNFLLVFGEYIPFYEQFPQLKTWFPAMAHFARGTTVTTFNVNGYKAGPLICYEDIIPRFARRVAALQPNFFVNITNDAWFGATSEAL